jgi:hypothetical protein
MSEFGGPIVEDHARLARRCGTTKVAFSRTVDLFLAKRILERCDGNLSSDYMLAEFAKREEISSVRSKNAKSHRRKNEQNQHPVGANAAREDKRRRGEDDGGENPPPSASSPTSDSTIDDSGRSMTKGARTPDGGAPQSPDKEGDWYEDEIPF